MEVWTKEKLFEYVLEQYGDQALDAKNLIERWLSRGDGAAIYTNHDLGSSTVGEPRIVSYGSRNANLEGRVPPVRLPDGLPAGAVNWRFQLDAVCGGPASTMRDLCPVCHSYADFPCKDQSHIPSHRGKFNQTDHPGRPATQPRDYTDYDKMVPVADEPGIHGGDK